MCAVAVMPAGEVIAKYHELWRVEQLISYVQESDLRARPMFHRTRDAIEAHLTIVITALAVARNIQTCTGLACVGSCAPQAAAVSDHRYQRRYRDLPTRPGPQVDAILNALKNETQGISQ